jgi:hypothetical protein
MNTWRKSEAMLRLYFAVFIKEPLITFVCCAGIFWICAAGFFLCAAVFVYYDQYLDIAAIAITAGVVSSILKSVTRDWNRPEANPLRD